MKTHNDKLISGAEPIGLIYDSMFGAQQCKNWDVDKRKIFTKKSVFDVLCS